MNKIFFCLLLSISTNAYCQTDAIDSTEEIESIHIDSFFENKTDYLIFSKIIVLDSTNSEEIIKRIKNWGGINFVNFKEVLITETDDQLVLNYINKSFFIETLFGNVTKEWYIRLVIQVKNNKIRLQFYDDGVVGVVGQYGYASRSEFMNSFFNKEENTTCRKMYCKGFLSLKNKIISTANDIEGNVKKTTIKKDDW